jgi:hypothetical protein
MDKILVLSILAVNITVLIAIIYGDTLVTSRLAALMV